MLTLNDGRSELWQWDTGRTLTVDADCSQVHFSNKVFGRSIDVDVVDGVATIPDILLQTDKDLNVWAFVGTAENGYTKISKTFKINRRNKPADYVFTQTEQMTLQMIQLQIGDLADLTTEAKDTLVAAINEAARTGGDAGSMDLRVADGYVQYSRDGGSTWENLIAMADLKGDTGTAGKDGHSPVVTATKSGKTTTISVDGTAIATVEDGADGAPGSRGADGITPTIGSNGNWYLGETDTGKPSRGEGGSAGATGATGEKGADGKSAYQYAVDGGYTGTEEEFSKKLASDVLIVAITESNGTLSASKTYVDIMDAILAGTTVLVGYEVFDLPLIGTSESLFFGTTMLSDDGSGAAVGSVIIEITQNDEVHDLSARVNIPKTLPNPNALTFTGAVAGSYDGSEPLTVNIPSSGGGSGGSGGLPNWRLIKTLVFSSEIAEIVFSEDDNGEAFAVKEIMIVGTVPAYTSGGYIYCGIATGGLNAVWPTAGKEMRWWLASVNGVLKTMLATSSTSVTATTDKNYGCPSDLVEIRVGASKGFTGNGTLYVYGR